MRKPNPGSVTFGGRPAICFLAHRNGTDQTSVSSTATINFTHTSFNVGGWYSTASFDFAPPAGLYRMHLKFNTATSPAANTRARAVIEKDGTTEFQGVDIATPIVQGAAAEVTGIIETTGTSVYKALISIAGTATASINGSRAQSWWMADEIVRAPR